MMSGNLRLFLIVVGIVIVSGGARAGLLKLRQRYRHWQVRRMLRER